MKSNAQVSKKDTELHKSRDNKQKQALRVFLKILFSSKVLGVGIALLFVGTLPLWEKIPIDEEQVHKEQVDETETARGAVEQDFEKTQQLTNSENQTKQVKPRQFKCESGESGIYYFACKLQESRILAPLQNIGVVVAAILYVLEIGQRRKQQHRQAWQVIDGARHVETSGARMQALEELVEDGESLRGLDADGADLIEIRLQGADLSDACLTRANLKLAELQHTLLCRAKLNEADLRGANLEGAILKKAQLDRINRKLGGFQLQGKASTVNLMSADLGDASLEGANLEYANLEGAVLAAANLQNASFRYAKLGGVDFTGADLKGTKFACAQGLILEQLKKATNWEQALYDKTFCHKHLDESLREDDEKQDIFGYEESIEDGEKAEIPVELKLLSCVQHMLILREETRHRELQDIRSKIAELLALLEKESLSSLKDSGQINELMTAVEGLSHSEEDQAKTMAVRNDAVLIQKEIDRDDFLVSEIRRTEEENENDLKPFHEAGNWMISSVELISNRAIQQYIKEKNQSPPNIQNLYNGISECLKKVGYHLINFHLLETTRPSYEDLKNHLSDSIKLEILQLILKKIIPDIFVESNPKISENARKSLEWILEESIKVIKSKE